jgi:hypothetical protein
MIDNVSHLVSLTASCIISTINLWKKEHSILSLQQEIEHQYYGTNFILGKR